MTTLKQRYWAEAGAWLLFIYITIPFVRPITEFLRETNLLSAAIVICAALLVYLYFKRLTAGGKLDKVEWLLLALAVGSYAVGLKVITIPEERIHFIQYGVLAILVNRAFHVDQRGVGLFVMTFGIVSFFGWVDEIIQYFTPERYYDNKDVFLNSISGVLGLLLDFIARRKVIREKGLQC